MKNENIVTREISSTNVKEKVYSAKKKEKVPG
jgi:hypothetical protein